jgi:hypothetical protein
MDLPMDVLPTPGGPTRHRILPCKEGGGRGSRGAQAGAEGLSQARRLKLLRKGR